MVWPSMRLPAVLLLSLALSDVALGVSWRDLFSPELRATERRQAAAREEWSALGETVVGNTVPQLGFQIEQKPAPPPESPWVQVDLGSSQRLDLVALVPVLVDSQPLERGAYGFPRRFRVDLSEDVSFATFTPLLDATDEDFPPPGVGPVLIPAAGRAGRFIRVTVTRLAEENRTFFFALAELMALQGNRNIALDCAVTASGSVNLPPRWSTRYVTDGRTPLGPPIQRGVMPQFDALFAGEPAGGSPAWMAVDLGAEMALDEVRLHPEHARQGADVPGFRFPAQFRVELASRADFSDAQALFDSAGEDFPNPGNNPVTIPAHGRRGRHVRVVMIKSETPSKPEFSLSELEVQAGGHLASLGATVTSSGDWRHDAARPLDQLTDGFTSYGRLLELPQWLEQWGRRSALRRTIRELEAKLPEQVVAADHRAGWAALTTVLGAGLALLLFSLRARSGRRAEQERFRTQLAQDLHDELGSNLAGIARLSEVAEIAGPGDGSDLREIQRIAHESTDAMREVLWLVGARQETGIELGRQMQVAAARLLAGREVRWTHLPEALPSRWTTETHRQVFLFFKEALANIVRHSRATAVELSAQISDDCFELKIGDNGRGFAAVATSGGIGLKSMRDRAAALGGSCLIESQPGAGTQITLKIPFLHR
jgi:signal transduction histidine kinase